MIVLILVLVESGLGAATDNVNEHIDNSLNPCFSGKWSWRPNVHHEGVEY